METRSTTPTAAARPPAAHSPQRRCRRLHGRGQGHRHQVDAQEPQRQGGHLGRPGLPRRRRVEGLGGDAQGEPDRQEDPGGQQQAAQAGVEVRAGSCGARRRDTELAKPPAKNTRGITCSSQVAIRVPGISARALTLSTRSGSQTTVVVAQWPSTTSDDAGHPQQVDEAGRAPRGTAPVPWPGRVAPRLAAATPRPRNAARSAGHRLGAVQGRGLGPGEVVALAQARPAGPRRSSAWARCRWGAPGPGPDRPGRGPPGGWLRQPAGPPSGPFPEVGAPGHLGSAQALRQAVPQQTPWRRRSRRPPREPGRTTLRWVLTHRPWRR